MGTPSNVVLATEGTKAGTQEAHDAILSDLRNLAFIVNQNKPGVNQPSSYGGGPTAQTPTAGLGKVFGTSNVSVAASSSGYYTLTAMVNGATRSGGTSVATNAQAITAYVPFYLGTMPVSSGSMVEVKIASTGAPATSLTNANISVRVDLSPAATS